MVKAGATDVTIESVGARKVIASANVTIGKLGSLDQIMRELENIFVRVDFVGEPSRSLQLVSIEAVPD
jgi:hypothetical protein